MVHLLGTFHPDSDEGPCKLQACLEQTRPTFLLSEISEDEVNHRETIKTKLFDQLAPLVLQHQTLSALLDHDWGPGWEYREARRHAEAIGAEHRLVDLYGKAKRAHLDLSYQGYLAAHVRAFKEKGSPRAADSVLLWVLSQSNENRKAHLRRVRPILTGLVNADNPSVNDVRLAAGAGEVFGERDAHWERVIRALNGTNATVTFVVGGGHMLNSPSLGTLYSRIRDLRPARTLI
jgi:hypothetical protein